MPMKMTQTVLVKSATGGNFEFDECGQIVAVYYMDDYFVGKVINIVSAGEAETSGLYGKNSPEAANIFLLMCA